MQLKYVRMYPPTTLGQQFSVVIECTQGNYLVN